MKLQKGDVIYLEKGQGVYVNIPQRFVYYNSILSDEITSTKIIIGDILSNKIEDEDFEKELNYLINSIIGDFESRFGYTINRKKVEQFVIDNINYKIEQYDTSIFIGEYIVVSAYEESSSSGHGRGDDYSGGWRVECKKLNNDKYDSNGLEIYFFQSGCYTAMIENIEPIRKMKMTFC
jgi:hypothetical protein